MSLILPVAQTAYLVARAKGQRAKPKRVGIKPSFFPPASFPQRDAEGKEWLANKAQKPALGKEESPPFWASRLSFCPGMGLSCPGEFFLFVEPSETMPFSERKPFSLPTKLGMPRNLSL